MSDDRVAVSARVPASLARKLEAKMSAEGRTKQAILQELIEHELDPGANGDILDLPTVADMLRVSQDAVLDRIRQGDFPARRFGDEWRCSRTAVLAWLDGTDPVPQRGSALRLSQLI